MIAFWLAATALAGGYYHPNDIAAASKSFARASESAPIYEEAESTSRAMATALRLYEENLDLLGPSAPAAERERLETLSKTYNREQAELQRFAFTLMDDYDRVFTAAMERAVATLEDAVLCESVISTRSLPGMPAKTEANPDCTGDNLNPVVTAAMDADAVLTAQLDELASRAWPAITTPSEPAPPIGDSERWIAVDRFFAAAASDQIRAIRQADEDQRLPIAAALEEGADPASQLDAAREITASTAKARAEMGADLFAAVAAANAKRAKKGKPTVSWCANPVLLGGCTGENVSGDEIDALLADKRVAKALP